MGVLGNILWIFLGGGIIIFFEYIIGGILLCVTIVGIPFGVQCFKLAVLGLMPFGREVDQEKSTSGCLALVLNIFWIITAGIALAVTHLFFALLCALTIIGLPFAKQHLKLTALALMPFGAKIK